MKKTNIKILLLLLTTGVLVKGASAQAEFKFLSYNVLHGFSYDTLVRNQFIDWVKKINPDVVAYQELNEYKQSMLEEVGKRIGHPYAVISKERSDLLIEAGLVFRPAGKH